MEQEIIHSNVQYAFVFDGKNPKDKPENSKAYYYDKEKYFEIFGFRPIAGQSVGIPRPERQALQQGMVGATENLVQGSPQIVFTIKDIQYTNDGIFVWYNELKYPRKGFPYPEACYANNEAKRGFVALLRSFASNPLMAILLLRKKTLEKFIHEYCSFAEVCMKPYFWKPEYYSKTAKEINKFITILLTEYGFTNRPSLPGRIISHFFDFDDAYMFRLQDIMNLSSKIRMLNNQAKELTKLFTIFKERESRPLMKEKVKGLLLLLKLCFLIPSFKRAFKKAVEESDFINFQMDEGDCYNVLRWDDTYKFLGRTKKDRQQEFLEIHDNVIPKFSVIEATNKSL